MKNLPEVQSILAKAGLIETRKKMYEKYMSQSVSSNISISQCNDSKNASKNNISKLQQSFNKSNLSKGQIKLMNSIIKRIQLQKGNLKLTNDSLDPTMNWIKIDEKNEQKEKKWIGKNIQYRSFSCIWLFKGLDSCCASGQILDNSSL